MPRHLLRGSSRRDLNLNHNPKMQGCARCGGLLFGQPLLLEGEDGATYHELQAQIWAAVKPVDVIDEMFTVDVVSSEFEVLRWPRLKLSLIRKRAIEGLEECLVEELQYDLYCDYFVDDLTEILEDNLKEDQVNSAQALAQQYALNETNAVIMVSKVLAIAGLNMDRISQDARERKVKDLVQAYTQREPDAVTVVDELLSSAGTSIDIPHGRGTCRRTRLRRAGRPPRDDRREPPQRQPTRDRPPSAASCRIAATERATDRIRRARSL